MSTALLESRIVTVNTVIVIIVLKFLSSHWPDLQICRIIIAPYCAKIPFTVLA